MRFNQGVSAERITDDTVRITAKGNAYTSETNIQDYLLLKAAETTIASQQSHFLIVSATDITRKELFMTPGMFAGDIYIPSNASVANFPGAFIIIKMGTPRNTNDLSLPGLHDAANIIRNVGPRVYPKKSKS
jgi:hypothetical protein